MYIIRQRRIIKMRISSYAIGVLATTVLVAQSTHAFQTTNTNNRHTTKLYSTKERTPTVSKISQQESPSLVLLIMCMCVVLLQEHYYTNICYYHPTTSSVHTCETSRCERCNHK